MQITDYLDGINPSTAKQYRSTTKYLDGWQQCLITMPHLTFGKYLANLKLAENTQAKHIRQARIISKACNLGYEIEPKQNIIKEPPKFTDSDFHNLYPFTGF